MNEQPTPWDLIFGPPAFDDSRFEQVKAEDRGRAQAPPELLMQSAAGALLRDLLPPHARETADAADPAAAGPDAAGGAPAPAHSAMVAQVSALLFHAYRYWLHDRVTLRITAEQLGPLLDGAVPPEDWQFRTPAPAGYVQFPRNALWARVEEGAAAEPVDGFFWNAPAASAGRDAAARGGTGAAAEERAAPADGGGSEAESRAALARLDLLLALGVRAGRPGLSLVSVTVEAPVSLEQWARADARPGGRDFANVLPGGELQDYHALTTHAEVLKLAVLCFWHLDR